MDTRQGRHDRSVTGPGARTTGGLLVTAAGLVNGAFAGLGPAFDYPQVLAQPAGEVLVRFAGSPMLVGGLFLLLATGAALLAPIAVGTARLAGPSRWSRVALVTGIAAAVVQVVGLLRWPLLVPGLAATASDPAATVAERTAAEQRYEFWGTVLGRVVGEAGGYLLTAAFTVALLLAWRRRYALSRIPTALAVLSVPMILAGLLEPLGVAAASPVNFVGYVLWSLWIVAVGVTLLRTGTPGPVRSDPNPRAAVGPEPVAAA